MKKFEKLYLIIAFVIVPFILSAQPNPSDPGNDSGGPIIVGEGAPINGGILSLLLMAIVYGSAKFVSWKKKRLE